MYQIVEGLLKVLKQKGVDMVYNTHLVEARYEKDRLTALVDSKGKSWEADLFVVNADAAWFRGTVFKRRKYRPQRLDKILSRLLRPFHQQIVDIVIIVLPGKGGPANPPHLNRNFGNRF